ARYVGPTTRLPPSAGRGWNRLPETVIANAIVANQCNPSSIKNIDRGGGAAIVIGRTLKPTAVESTPRRPKRGVFKTGILTQSVDLLEWTKGQYGQRHGTLRMELVMFGVLCVFMLVTTTSNRPPSATCRLVNNKVGDVVLPLISLTPPAAGRLVPFFCH